MGESGWWVFASGREQEGRDFALALFIWNCNANQQRWACEISFLYMSMVDPTPAWHGRQSNTCAYARWICYLALHVFRETGKILVLQHCSIGSKAERVAFMHIYDGSDAVHSLELSWQKIFYAYVICFIFLRTRIFFMHVSGGSTTSHYL